jgi:hypothetical protein
MAVDAAVHPDLEGLARKALDAYVAGGDGTNLDRSLELYRLAGTADAACSPGLGALIGYGTALLERYKLRGATADLESSITVGERCFAEPADGAQRIRALLMLATSLYLRHQLAADPADLARALDLAKQAMTLASEASADRADAVNTLIDVLWAYYFTFGDPAAVKLLGELYDHLPRDGADDPHEINRCSYLWAAHSLGTGDIELDQVIDRHRALLAERDDLLTSRADVIYNFAAALRKRAALPGGPGVAYLREESELYEAILDRQPIGTPLRFRYWAALADVTHEIFKARGDPQDLDRVIAYGETALREADPAAEDFGTLLIQLGGYLAARARLRSPASPDRSGDRQRAIELTSRVVAQARIGTPERGGALHTLAMLLADEHYAKQSPQTLDAAIAAAEELLASTPYDSPNLAVASHMLAGFLLSRETLSGTGIDLERAIAVIERCRALLHKTGQPSTDLLGLQGDALLRRYGRTGDTSDLSAVILSHESALAEGPEDPYLAAELTANLGSAYRDRFDQHGDPSDLDRAITLFEAKAAAPADPNRQQALNMLALALGARYRNRGVPGDLDRAIECLRTIQAMPAFPLDRKGGEANLALFLLTRYDRDHAMPDLHQAVSILTRLAAETADGSPGRAELLSGLGTALEKSFQDTGDTQFLLKAIDAWTEAWDIQQASFPGLAASYQHGHATNWSTLHADLVTALIDAAQHVPTEAVRLRRQALIVAESAKSRILADQMSRLDVIVPPVLEDLAGREQALMRQMARLDAAGLQGFLRPEPGPTTLPDGGYPAARRRIVEQLEQVWAEMEAAGGEEGTRYVVRRRAPAWTWNDVTASAERSGEGTALVSLFLTGESTIFFVYRPGWAAPEAVRLDLAAWHWSRARELLYREVIRPGTGSVSETWHRPIMAALKAARPHLAGATHIVLAPMGDAHLLPWPVVFHRFAGDSRRSPVLTLLPSLTALSRFAARSPGQHSERALVVGDPAGNLPHAAEEARRVASVLGTTARIGLQATLETVRAGLSDAHIVHLATHAEFAPDSPYESNLLFADGRLSVGDIAGLRITARLVILSACETAVANIGGGDSLTGLAQAFLQAGATGLVVSLWQVDDSATAELMRRFHENRLNGANDADALHAAIPAVRDIESWASPYFWGAFVYMGL